MVGGAKNEKEIEHNNKNQESGNGSKFEGQNDSLECRQKA